MIELTDEEDNWDLEVGGPHVLIGFTQVPGPSEQGLVRAHGGVIKYSYSLVPAIAASIPEAAIAGLLHNPHITGIEPDGTVTFSLKNAPSGWYTTTVTNVSVAGLTWDGKTPENEFEKK